MTNPELQARLEGQMAALNRRPITDNPHEPGAEHNAWIFGYREIKL